MSKQYLGDVRPTSYDEASARPFGQTAAEITVEAGQQFAADVLGEFNEVKRHVPRPDRYYLLRFLGLNAEADALLDGAR